MVNEILLTVLDKLNLSYRTSFSPRGGATQGLDSSRQALSTSKALAVEIVTII